MSMDWSTHHDDRSLGGSSVASGGGGASSAAGGAAAAPRVAVNNNKRGLSGPPIRVACIGGGELSRMMAMEAPRLHVQMAFMDPSGNSCPVSQMVRSSRILEGSLQDSDKIRQFAGKADVVTVEATEHVNVEALEELESKGAKIRPSSRVLAILQDKYIQKTIFRDSNSSNPPAAAAAAGGDRDGGIAGANKKEDDEVILQTKFKVTPSIAAIQEACDELGLPLMLKLCKGGSDGRGNVALESSLEDDVVAALETLGVDTTADYLNVYAEEWVDFKSEVGVVVVRSSDGRDAAAYPASDVVHETDGLCRLVMAPSRYVRGDAREQCERIAVRAVERLGEGACGTFAVKLFVTRSGKILLNEVLPRPHVMGHYTQDACPVNQFENHLRSICGLPLGATSMTAGAAATVCVLGAPSGLTEETLRSSNAAMYMDVATIHWYGRHVCSVGQRVGHINLTAAAPPKLDAPLAELMRLERISMEVLPGKRLPPQPLVGIIVGSQTDLSPMYSAVEILKRFNVPFEVDIVSAHRTPDKLRDYGREAAGRGLRVIIAGAGGAAHLPGMVASLTPLPVIGVPVKTPALNGMDALYSIVQMPRGVPVATVAIGNASNAGLLAVRILSVGRPDLIKQMVLYQKELKDLVEDMSNVISELGIEAVMEQLDPNRAAESRSRSNRRKSLG